MSVRDILIDPIEHDIDFRNFRLTQVGGESTAQKVKIRLLFFFREWRLNQNQGTRWFETILVKGALEYNVNQEIQRRVLETRGVRAMEDYKFSLDDAQRTFSCSFKVIDDTNNVEEVNIEDFQL